MPLDRGFLLPKIRVNRSENEGYGLRLEKKIDNMQADIRMLSDHVTCLKIPQGLINRCKVEKALFKKFPKNDIHLTVNIGFNLFIMSRMATYLNLYFI